MRKLFVVVALAFVSAIHTLAEEKSTRPNIILILADDLGIGNVSCYGADNFKTPNLDALAKNGIRFQHCYAQPLCGPSRAQIMTGRYAFRTGMTGNDSGILIKPENETMIPKTLKTAGYASVQVGKWGQLPLQPADFGFDEYLRYTGSGIYWNTQEKGRGYILNGKEKKLANKRYMPDLIHDYLIDFITRHRDEPFFAYYSLSHIHGEILPTPDSAPGSKDLYADNIAYMDKLVGKLIDELERLKLREKTLLIFVGDNGTAKGEYERSTVNGKTLSGHKSDMLEGGSLVPMIANWPGTTPKGKILNDLIDFSDYLPTFAELAGAKHPGATIDGKSFAAQLRGERAQPRDWIFVELGRHWYVRDANWKLNEVSELFDMKGAPFEEKLISRDSKDSSATAARKRLQTVLDQLSPATGKVDAGDGSGKHANKVKKESAKKANP